MRPSPAIVTFFALALVAALARPLRAQTSGRPQLVVVLAEADLAAGTLLLEGHYFVWANDSQATVTLGGTSLTVLEITDSHVLASLTPALGPGSYRVKVSRGSGAVQNDTIDVAVGAVGATGAQGPPGVPGAPGAPGADGLSCWDGDANGGCDVATEDANGDGACDALDCRGAQGPTGLPGTPGLPGAPGPRGADGPPGPSGSLEGLACVSGELPRWNGSTWICSKEGESLEPPATFGTGTGSVTGDCNREGEGETCEATGPSVTLGDGPAAAWASFGGAGVRTVFVPDPQGSLIALGLVDELILRRQLAGFARLTWDGHSTGLSSIEVSPLVIPAVALPFSFQTPWKEFVPGAAAPVWLTLTTASEATSVGLHGWWLDYVVERHEQGKEVTVEIENGAGQVVSYEFTQCIPLAWRPQVLVIRCSFTRYRKEPTDAFAAWLDDFLSGSGATRDVTIDEVGRESGTLVRRFVYGDAFISRYVFPRFDAQHGGAIETVMMRASRLEL